MSARIATRLLNHQFVLPPLLVLCTICAAFVHYSLLVIRQTLPTIVFNNETISRRRARVTLGINNLHIRIPVHNYRNRYHVKPRACANVSVFCLRFFAVFLPDRHNRSVKTCSFDSIKLETSFKLDCCFKCRKLGNITSTCITEVK